MGRVGDIWAFESVNGSVWTLLRSEIGSKGIREGLYTCMGEHANCCVLVPSVVPSCGLVV